jgi:predicted PhzF superfamily epimerase YddE/YHI9
LTRIHVLRVFTDASGAHGNALGVVLDGASVAESDRQALATELGFSETVFVDDLSTGAVRIFTPAVELSLAGHPLVGTSWLLHQEGHDVDVLRPPAGDVPTWVEGDQTWIRAPSSWSPPWDRLQLDSAEEVEALDGPPGGHDHLEVWSWEDEGAGAVRARAFGLAYGIVEDEATGSAALLLAQAVGRPVTIRQGRGSVLHARPGPAGTAEVGGLVVLDEVRASRAW